MPGWCHEHATTCLQDMESGWKMRFQCAQSSWWVSKNKLSDKWQRLLFTLMSHWGKPTRMCVLHVNTAAWVTHRAATITNCKVWGDFPLYALFNSPIITMLAWIESAKTLLYHRNTLWLNNKWWKVEAVKVTNSCYFNISQWLCVLFWLRSTLKPC